MGEQKWFRSKSFFATLFSVLFDILKEAASSVMGRLGNNRKRKKGGSAKKRPVKR